MIKLADIREAVSSRIRGGGAEFDAAFHRAVNCVIRDLLLDTVIESLHEYDIDHPPETLPIPTKYVHVFYEGVPYWMQRLAKWARQEGDEVSDTFYRRELARAQVMALNDDPMVGYKMLYED